MTRGTQVSAYVPDEQRERWDKKAEEMGMGRSKWIKAMVEAGLKKFSRDIQPSETRDDLRRKRNDLHEQLSLARKRIEDLEARLNISEDEAILKYLEENPGAEYRDLVQYVVNTANSRVARLLDQMEGNDIKIDEQGRMYTR